jgi:sugar/nucleoside kinase (ribokinase family)
MSMTLSDPFCVGRYREEFLDLMRSGTIDIVFANADEAKVALRDRQFRTCRRQLRKDCKLAAITRSEHGSVIVRGDERVDIDAIDIDEVVDTTGAGDLYAAGFLHGYANGKPLDVCGKLGSLAAGLVIQQIGPRPQLSLKDAAVKANLA